MGLTWPRWRAVAAEAERLGFAGIFRSDHFTNPSGDPDDALELITSLTYLATATERLHFGPLVAPVSFRDPVHLARQAAAIADLSGGRMILGLGAGWQDREHEAFGYELGDVPSRFARLQEGLEVVTRLLRAAPASFEGRFFTLREAPMLPAPAHPIPILVGGNGPRRVLPLAARFADVWNGIFLTPEDFAARCATLDELCAAAGRSPDAVRRTMMTGAYVGEKAWDRLRANPSLQGKNDEEIGELLRSRGALAGDAGDVRDQLAALEKAGADELMVQWLDLNDLDGLASLAEILL